MSDSKAANEEAKSSTIDSQPSADFVSKLDEYEELFKDRYTENDSEYMKRVNSQPQPIIVHPWPPKRDFYERSDRQRHNHWRGGGGDRRRY
ncbi:RNMT-activating mRNA cap methyltransferase subunit [Aphelenchoides besseyi]|nr:RNMT-activating mRNA cap methyltransferase subunit [Aphelenchoides besseyi]